MQFRCFIHQPNKKLLCFYSHSCSTSSSRSLLLEIKRPIQTAQLHSNKQHFCRDFFDAFTLASNGQTQESYQCYFQTISLSASCGWSPLGSMSLLTTLLLNVSPDRIPNFQAYLHQWNLPLRPNQRLLHSGLFLLQPHVLSQLLQSWHSGRFPYTPDVSKRLKETLNDLLMLVQTQGMNQEHFNSILFLKCLLIRCGHPNSTTWQMIPQWISTMEDFGVGLDAQSLHIILQAASREIKVLQSIKDTQSPLEQNDHSEACWSVFKTASQLLVDPCYQDLLPKNHAFFQQYYDLANTTTKKLSFSHLPQLISFALSMSRQQQALGILHNSQSYSSLITLFATCKVHGLMFHWFRAMKLQGWHRGAELYAAVLGACVGDEKAAEYAVMMLFPQMLQEIPKVTPSKQMLHQFLSCAHLIQEFNQGQQILKGI